MREIALDTETTDLSPKDGHRVIEIGAVEMVNKIRTGNVFHIYINPQCQVSNGAFQVHGISNEFLADKPIMADVIADFEAFIADSKLVIHNAPFDMGFLNNELRLLKRPYLEMDRAIDTLQLARKKYPGGQNSLDGLCRRFNIDLSTRTKHGALLDAGLLADVYAEMMGVGANQRNLMFAEANKEEVVEAQILQLRPENAQTLPARDFPASAAELSAHGEFVEKNKLQIWQKLLVAGENA